MTDIHEELREYIDAFKGSSDRARHVLMTILTVSLLMAVANYNISPFGWPTNRSQEIVKYGWQGPELPKVPEPGWLRSDRQDAASTHLGDRPLDTALEQERVLEARRRISDWRLSQSLEAKDLLQDALVLDAVRQKYIEQFIERAIVVSSPIPGVWLDANDLGTIGGGALLFLMVVLVYYLAREHENLYLALYRVRTLCHDDPHHQEGTSRANFLYHALAMRQALSFPPTLARWGRRRRFVRLHLVFFVPAAVYIWVVWPVLSQVDKPAIVGSYRPELDFILVLQAALVFVLYGLSALAAAYSASMARRWESGFDSVNPTRRGTPQASVGRWLSLRLVDEEGGVLERRLSSQISDTIRRWPESGSRSRNTVTATAAVELSGERIDRKARDAMVTELIGEAKRRAEGRCRARGRSTLWLVECHVVKNEWKKNKWVVSAKFAFRCDGSATQS